MKRHIEKTREHLGELDQLAARTDASERAILAAAEKRLDAVERMISRLAPGADTAPDAHQQRYLDLVAERGQLHIVIGKAKATLA